MKHSPFCLPHLALLVLLVGTVALHASAEAQTSAISGEAPWRVVLLNNADFFLPASTIMDQTLRQTLVKEAPRQVDLYGETLDLLRYPHEIEPELVALLGKKYAGKPIDLILARAQGGLEFAVRYRDALWPGVPIVFYNNVADVVRGQALPPNTTGLLIDLDPEGTIELARRLHPDMRHLYVVGGTAEYDQRWMQRVKSILGRHAEAVPVTLLNDVPLPRILEQVAQLPENSVVLFTSMVRDVTGRPQNSPQVAELIARTANAPVYGFLGTYIGQGVVGGAITDFAAQGRAAAQLALRVLNGAAASTIPVQPSPQARCIVDARSMERWRIEERRLPADCEVQFRTPTLWRDYRWYFLGTILALVFQAALIATLLVQRRRRHQAEMEASNRRVELIRASRLALAGELAASIAHEINQPLGAILANTGAAKELLGRVPVDLDEIRNIIADIHKADLRAGEVIRRVRALLTKGDVERQPTDINVLVGDTLELLESEALRRGVAISKELAANLPSAYADRIQLQQALLNLAVNGMDAMVDTESSRQQLVVRTAQIDGDKVEISVSDNGSGISGQELPRLFDSFFTTKPHGIGLGLSISRSIVEAHGGTLSVENRTGGGATFRILLPVEFTAAPTSTSSRVPTGTGEPQ